MRYYLKTSDPEMVASFRELSEMESAREKYVRRLAKTWGFDEIGISGFSSLVAFFKLATEDERKLRLGPPIEGFRACRENPREYHNSRLYFRYYFHGNRKLGNQLRKQLEEGMPPMPNELGGSLYRRTVDAAFCARHGLPDGHFSGGKVLFSTIHLLRGDFLVMSLPVTGEEAVIPDNCEEVTERTWGTEIDKHNASVKETSHDNQ